MFKKENRLAPGVKFNNSYSSALPQFALKVMGNNLPVNRFGIIVSKKIDKTAVGRNQVKRFFRTTLMSLFEKMSFGHDILFIVKKEVLSKAKEDNVLAIENSLSKAGVLKK